MPLPFLALLSTSALARSPESPSLSELAERFAPVLVQETRAKRENRTQDLPVPFDFDGNWEMTDNWDHQPEWTTNAQPTLYWAGARTERRAYLTYLLFYPRDWSRFCLPFVCHENDLEQFTIVVEAGDDAPLLMDVKFHTGEAAYPRVDLRAGPRKPARGRLTTTSDPVPASGVRVPLVRVEWGGHGVLSCDADGDGQVDAACAHPKEALLLTPRAMPTEGLAVGAERHTYDLQPLQTTLWPRRRAIGPTWASKVLAYVGQRLGRVGSPLGMAFAGSGIDGGARAPWGVSAHDGLGAGDRFLDPALAIDRRWQMPGGSDDGAYLEHPMLDDLKRECVGEACQGR